MTNGLSLQAPAKINWTLEVLGRRDDGYHVVRTVLQTIALSDGVTLSSANDLSLEISGDAGALSSLPDEANLAYRAAERLLKGPGATGGVRIQLEKGIPVAAGLGGGSSDAAAVLRGTRRLLQLPVSDRTLAEIAAELGSDVPFFLRGGCALASGRGTELTPLPNGPPQRLVVAWPERSISDDKTARMYAALGPEHLDDGSATDVLASRLEGGQPVRDGDIVNVFEHVLDAAGVRLLAATRELASFHLAGSGPAIFSMLEPDDDGTRLIENLTLLGLRAVVTRTTAAAEARG